MYISHSPRVELQSSIQQQRELGFFLLVSSREPPETVLSSSFQSIVGSFCSYDGRDKKKSTELVPLFTCQKDVSSHQSA